MTGHKEALQALLEKVEAGEWAKRSVVLACFGDVPQLSQKSLSAFQGSLDAAKALHEAVLPGWGAACSFDFYTGVIRSQARVSHLGIHHGAKIDDPYIIRPARAWLIAILKALIAQEAD